MCHRGYNQGPAWGPVMPAGSVAPCSSGAPAPASTSSHLSPCRRVSTPTTQLAVTPCRPDSPQRSHVLEGVLPLECA